MQLSVLASAIDKPIAVEHKFKPIFNFQKVLPARAVCVNVQYKPHDFCDR